MTRTTVAPSATTTTGRRSRTATALVIAAMSGALLIAGCSSGTSSSSVPAEQQVVPTKAATTSYTAQSGATGTTVPGEAIPRSLTRSATMSMTVTDASVAASRLRQIAREKGGQVTAENVVSRPGTRSTSTVTLSVPADRLDVTLDAIAGVGDVTDRGVKTADVTDKVADVDARIKTQRESIARMQALLAKAQSVSEIAQVEAELTKRQADLESLLAQQQALANQVAASPITVTMTTAAAPVTAPEPKKMGFVTGLEAGWESVVFFVRTLGMILGVALPWLALGALIAAPIVVLVRRAKARRVARSSSRTGP